MPRHSFIQMTKLHNVMGRIDYITSTVKQENLYAIYATQPLRSFWKDLAKCNREEFAKSGTIGKYIEARELIIALPEGLYHYEHDYLIKHFATDFKKKYGVDCYAALHHNKRKTKEIRNAWYILMPERRYICRIILIQGQIIMRHCLYHLKHHTIGCYP